MMMNKKHRYLRIGLDYHGVINSDMPYFKCFCQQAIARGHKIHILSGGPEEKILNKLNEEGFEFTKVFAIFDYYNEKGLACRLPNGEFYVNDQLWNETKAHYCRQHKIDIQIDDSPVYGKYFTTPYCLYDHKQKNCRLIWDKKTIDIEMCEPQLAVKMIEDIFC